MPNIALGPRPYQLIHVGSGDFAHEPLFAVPVRTGPQRNLLVGLTFDADPGIYTVNVLGGLIDDLDSTVIVSTFNGTDDAQNGVSIPDFTYPFMSLEINMANDDVQAIFNIIYN